MREQDLGGIMFWSLDNDDFRGICNGEQYPLVEAGKKALFGADDTKSNEARRLEATPRYVRGPRRRSCRKCVDGNAVLAKRVVGGNELRRGRKDRERGKGWIEWEKKGGSQNAVECGLFFADWGPTLVFASVCA